MLESRTLILSLIDFLLFGSKKYFDLARGIATVGRAVLLATLLLDNGGHTGQFVAIPGDWVVQFWVNVHDARTLWLLLGWR